MAQMLGVLESRIVDMYRGDAPPGYFYVALTGLKRPEMSEVYFPKACASALLVKRDYSRAQVDALAAAVRAVIPGSEAGNVRAYYPQGAVLVTVAGADEIPGVAQAIASVSGVAPLAGESADDAIRDTLDGGPGQIPSSPRIALKPAIFPRPEPSLDGDGQVGSMCTEVVAKTVPGRVRAGSKATVRVSVVGADHFSQLSGTVTVTWKGGSKKVALRGEDNGRTTVVLPRLPQGVYTVKVKYRPDRDLAYRYAAAQAMPVTLKVTGR
jgi:hypothetical protein